jgi:diadenosine tetraphosphate (Ap4A) HIT family hydrolase
MPSIFTKIIAGEMPGHFIWKDDVCVGLMTIAPLQPGHAMVVPRAEVDSWTDLEPDVMKHLIGVAQAIGRALDRAYQPEKVGLVILGLEVRHVHLHVSCIWKPTDLDFGNAKANTPPEAIAREADVLRTALRDLGYEHVVDR